MIGIILHYSNLTQRGVICDKDATRYPLHINDWQDEIMLQRGMKVVFDLNSEKQAIQIRLHLIAA